MPGIFISYAEEDLLAAKKIEEILVSRTIPVSSERKIVFENQHWAKDIAATISRHNIFLLVWSQYAATSAQIEYEWTIASKMNKFVFVLFLDKTPLSKELLVNKRLYLDDLENAVQTIIEQIKFSPPSHHRQNQELLKILEVIDSPDIGTVLKKVNQALTETDKNNELTQSNKSKKWFEKWQTVVTFLVVLLTLLTFVLDIPEKIKGFKEAILGTPIESLCLKGVIVDKNGQAVVGAIVRVDKLPTKAVATTNNGSFKFDEIPGNVGDSVRVSAYYKDKKIYDEYIALPGPLKIEMEGKQ